MQKQISPAPHKQNGLTLLELIIALSISAILISLALPSFTALIENNRANTSINRMVSALHYARTQAINHGKSVTLCPLQNSEICGQTWRQGLLIFIDNNRDGQHQTNETILQSGSPFPAGSQISWAAFGSNRYLRFTHEGYTANQNGRFTYCPKSRNNYYARQIIINKNGRPRQAEDKDSNGIIETTSGQDIQC